MAETHTHDWIELGTGAATCTAHGCQEAHHEHQYSQDARADLCPCGSWTPKPPTQPDQVSDLSRSDAHQRKPGRQRMVRTVRVG